MYKISISKENVVPILIFYFADIPLYFSIHNNEHRMNLKYIMVKLAEKLMD